MKNMQKLDVVSQAPEISNIEQLKGYLLNKIDFSQCPYSSAFTDYHSTTYQTWGEMVNSLMDRGINIGEVSLNDEILDDILISLRGLDLGVHAGVTDGVVFIDNDYTGDNLINIEASEFLSDKSFVAQMNESMNKKLQTYLQSQRPSINGQVIYVLESNQ